MLALERLLWSMGCRIARLIWVFLLIGRRALPKKISKALIFLLSLFQRSILFLFQAWRPTTIIVKIGDDIVLFIEFSSQSANHHSTSTFVTNHIQSSLKDTWKPFQYPEEVAWRALIDSSTIQLVDSFSLFIFANFTFGLPPFQNG